MLKLFLQIYSNISIICISLTTSEISFLYELVYLGFASGVYNLRSRTGIHTKPNALLFPFNF